VTGREGTTLGPYRLNRRLGGGGAGEVYLAEGPVHGGTPGLAAVKVLRGSAGDPLAREIASQAHAVAAQHQAHVLPIYHVGEEGGALYIAMAYAQAGSLGAVAQADGAGALSLPLSAGVVARLVNQVARALQPVHDRGLSHGDLKLENLFVRTAPSGGPMAAVADFGQAAVVGAAAAAAAAAPPGESDWVAYALRCAAPEQLTGPPVPASDQYALATIAYLLLTGRYPFAGDARSLGMAILREPPPPPTQFDPALAPEAEQVLLRALAKAPEARFPGIAAFARALDEALAAGQAASASVTQQFAALSGPIRSVAAGGHSAAASQVPRSAMGPAAAATRATLSAGASGARRTARPAAGGPGASGVRYGTQAPQPMRPGAPGAFLRRPLTPRQRLIAIAASVVTLAVLASCGLGLYTLLMPAAPRTSFPTFGGLDYAPTLTPNATQVALEQARAQAAQALLAAATHTPPVFSDSLADNSHNWPIDGKQTFFAGGQLHVFNRTPEIVLSIDQPVTPPLDFVVSVDLTFLRASGSDLAGVRFRVTPNAGHLDWHYTVLISPDGRYEFWRFKDGWEFLDNGFTPTVKRGLGVTNTLTVLAHGDMFYVFINGQYVSTVQDGALHSLPSAMGPTVIYSGSEVSFAHYTVYQVH
jgi:hypothetical protein